MECVGNLWGRPKAEAKARVTISARQKPETSQERSQAIRVVV